MTSEEVQRVNEALDAVEAIEDPEARSRAQSQITAEVRKRSSRWAEERGVLANQLKDQDEKVSIRDIAKRLGVSPGTVQDLLRGYKGSGQHRPRTTDTANSNDA
ncbi:MULTISPECIES: helix-turn-helix domain-containing protein [unclassified Streptomyces]|uniref:helix-turn-helix domain-containing protein n=1 Tax=unclassified Streptomyces TaxID=2593676 RepID=UPI003828D5F0